MRDPVAQVRLARRLLVLLAALTAVGLSALGLLATPAPSRVGAQNRVGAFIPAAQPRVGVRGAGSACSHPGSIASTAGIASGFCVAAEGGAGLRGLAPIAGGAPTAAETFGGEANLLRHFGSHGADFGAASAEDYANQAQAFLTRSRAEGLPTKVDQYGVVRTYDPATNTFGAYNANGTTRTFFKPTSPTYFDRQPGAP